MRILCCLLISAPLFAQSAPSPKFEVASIRPAPVGADYQVNIGVHVDGARVSYNSLTLKEMLGAAYKVKGYQIDCPPWVGTERYNIAATLPAGAKTDQIPDMIKALLADRFQLTLHHESKEFPVYALTVLKTGLKISESEPDPPGTTPPTAVNVTGGGGRNGISLDLGNGASFSFADNKLEGKKITMSYLADNLARFLDKPVVDMTGLTGKYDIKLTFTDEDYTAMLIRAGMNAGIAMPPQAIKMMESASGDSLPTAIQSAGLKLESRKAPLDVVVVDHAEKTPTEN